MKTECLRPVDDRTDEIAAFLLSDASRAAQSTPVAQLWDTLFWKTAKRFPILTQREFANGLKEAFERLRTAAVVEDRRSS